MRVTEKAAWIMGGCAVVASIIGAIALYVVGHKSAPPVAASATEVRARPVPTEAEPSPSPSVDVAEVLSDFEAYSRRWDALDDRFLEQEEFVASLVGRRVRWRGWVSGVSQSEGLGVIEDRVVLQLGLTKDFSIRSASVWFPADSRTKLYSLHSGDQVEVVATFDDGGLMPSLTGESVSLVGSREPSVNAKPDAASDRGVPR